MTTYRPTANAAAVFAMLGDAAVLEVGGEQADMIVGPDGSHYVAHAGKRIKLTRGDWVMRDDAAGVVRVLPDLAFRAAYEPDE